ncbi:uncharacterized protein METZ01_LOCUS509310, partial [marine metagenome]
FGPLPSRLQRFFAGGLVLLWVRCPVPLGFRRSLLEEGKLWRGGCLHPHHRCHLVLFLLSRHLSRSRRQRRIPRGRRHAGHLCLPCIRCRHGHRLAFDAATVTENRGQVFSSVHL